MVLVVLKEKKDDFDFKKLDKDEYLKFLNDFYDDSICCFNSKTQISTQVSKEHHHIFNLKYDIKVDLEDEEKGNEIDD